LEGQIVIYPAYIHKDKISAIPAPSDIEALRHAGTYAGGYWMLVEIDTGRLNPRAVRLNVSLRENPMRRMDDYARTWGHAQRFPG
jgi:hypothetical protein